MVIRFQVHSMEDNFRRIFSLLDLIEIPRIHKYKSDQNDILTFLAFLVYCLTYEAIK